MGKRVDLHEDLQSLIGVRSDGKTNVYFQPPESVKLNYPCIIYSRSSGRSQYASNMPYNFFPAYDVTIIYQDPDYELVNKMAVSFPKIRHDRHFTANNLNYDVYKLYY